MVDSPGNEQEKVKPGVFQDNGFFPVDSPGNRQGKPKSRVFPDEEFFPVL